MEKEVKPWKNEKKKKLQLFWEETLTSSKVTGETTARRKANGLVHRSISVGRGESQQPAAAVNQALLASPDSVVHDPGE